MQYDGWSVVFRRIRKFAIKLTIHPTISTWFYSCYTWTCGRSALPLSMAVLAAALEVQKLSEPPNPLASINKKINSHGSCLAYRSDIAVGRKVNIVQKFSS